MDDTSYCAGACKGGAMQTARGDWMCMSCCLALETRKAKLRSVVMPLPVNRRIQAAMRRHPASGTKPAAEVLQELQAKREVVVPETITQACTTCETGVIGQRRWDDGHRSCTRCAPLTLAAGGSNKAAPALLLLEQVSPEQVAGGRRRP